MTWFTANWFWVLIFIAFIAMHLFGHGGHGGHGSGHSGHGGGNRQRGEDEKEGDGRVVSASPGGHQH